MIYLIDVVWTLIYSNPSARSYRGRGTAFDPTTKTIVPFDETRGLATLDPNPVDVHVAVGDFIFQECAPDFTRTAWFYAGNGNTTTTTEANSPACGYVGPLTCNLGTAAVSQTATPTGTTLLVTFSGTLNGAALYALDGGPEQASPYFLRVAPGAHQVQIRDAGLAGCVLLVDVQVAAVPTGPGQLPAPSGPPLGIDFVAQPLWYPMSGQPAGALVELALWAESAHGLGDFAPLPMLRKRVARQGQVTFRLDTLLYPLLSAFVPPPATINASTVLCTKNLVNYYVRTTVTPLDPAQLPVAAVSELRTALRGGLPAEWQGVDYFARRLDGTYDQPPFLSWQPTGPGAQAAGQPKPVVREQPEWLFFLCPLDQTSAQLRVRRAYTMTTAGTPVVDLEPLAAPAAGGWANRLLAIPLKPSRAGFAYLSVQVETTGGLVLSQQAVYQFVDATPRTRYLLFTNSLGAVDTLRCEGRLEATLEATTEKVERPARFGEVSPAADRQVSDLTASRKLKLATGWLSAAQLAWLQELVLTREAWQYVSNQLRPLDLAKRSLATYSDEPTLRGLLLEFDYAYAPTAYAPNPYA